MMQESSGAEAVRRHEQARSIARAILDGFDRHYRLFRDCAVRARLLFEQADWA
jgi:isocitrate dehydrogenase kinase/phosphatase